MSIQLHNPTKEVIETAYKNEYNGNTDAETFWERRREDALLYEVLCGINDRASELDYDILLFSTNAKKQSAKSYSDLCRERNVEGAIISGLRVNDPYLQEVTSDTNFSCVLIDIPAEGHNPGHVTTDNKKGSTRPRSCLTICLKAVANIAKLSCKTNWSYVTAPCPS